MVCVMEIQLQIKARSTRWNEIFDEVISLSLDFECINAISSFAEGFIIMHSKKCEAKHIVVRPDICSERGSFIGTTSI